MSNMNNPNSNSSADNNFSSSRPQLIFKHNAKAGGGSIEKLLLQLKPIKYTGSNYLYRGSLQKRAHSYVNVATKNHTTALLASNETERNYTAPVPIHINPNDTLIIIPEFERVSKKHRQKGFVISNMREPCDQYLSLWAFGSAGHGGLYTRSKNKFYNWTLDAYGHDSPNFDSKEDIQRFQHKWLQDRNILGLIARRHLKSYGSPGIIRIADNSTMSSSHSSSSGNSTTRARKMTFKKYVPEMPDSVDCWVYVDDFQATLYSCLREYEIQGGLVDWDAPLLSKLTTSLRKKNSKRELQNYTKDDPIGNPQLSHHSKCSTYYDNATADLVQLGAESFIFEAFGYQGCCGGRNPKNTLIHPPPLLSSREVNGTSAPVKNDFDGMELNQTEETFKYQYPSLLLSMCVPVVGLVLIFVVRKLQKQRAEHRPKYAIAPQDEESEEMI